MKKIKYQPKLSLKKETIAKLNNNELNNIKGGLNWFTGGCTDGCTGTTFGATLWNCTHQGCTADCGTVICQTGAFCTA